MYSENGSTVGGTRSLVIFLTGALALAVSSAGAETAATINGRNIDSTVLAVFAESRTQRPIGELAEQDRKALMLELVDLYVLLTQPGNAELKNDPRVAAQIELQERAIVAQAYAAKFLAANVVTDEEIAAEYEIQAAGAASSQFKARHILVPTQSKAIDLIAKLDTGSDFATLAADSSIGPSAKDGGALCPGFLVVRWSNHSRTQSPR